LYHQHFDTCPSTQSYLKDNWSTLSQNDEQVLISTNHQTSGVGRRGSEWNNFENAIAFSMSLKPSDEFSLTSLELGVLIAEFFPKKISLKWPNDLLTPDVKKCGGIICNVVDSKTIIAGIGLNLYLSEQQDFDYKIPPGGIFQTPPQSSNFKEELPKTLAEYIHQNRLTNEEIQQKWNAHCLHFNQKVIIVDHNEKVEGVFKGINHIGSALIETDQGLKNIMSGSLFFE
jgi:BirA family biotin operon repressor/biotin-[acetyl-CoA-carboxylase] ligase